MNEIISVQLLHWGVFSAVLLVLCLYFSKRAELIGRLCFKGVMGTSLIFICNCFMYRIGIFLGLNCVTILVSAVLGIPGIALMYGLLLLP